MEFEGFQFNANSFLKVPGLDMKTEVIAVLKRSPGIIVGGNKPFFENLRKITKKHNKYTKITTHKHINHYQEQNDEDLDSIHEEEAALIQQFHQEQLNQSLWCSQVTNKQWVFLGGDLYVNFASFQEKNNNTDNYDSYSHWNEWRPSVKCLRLRNHLHLEMQTDNEGPVEFEGVRNALISLSNKDSFEVAQLLETYAKYLQMEESKIKGNLELINRNEQTQLQLLLSNNYEKSLVEAHNIIDRIGDTFPIVYFLRRTSLTTLRGQVSAIGLNYQLTQILCENKEKYMQALLRNGIPEVFSHETHLRLLLLNLRGEGGKEINIRTVDDIEVKCQLTLLYFPLSTVEFKGLKFTDTLRVYKFDINNEEMSKLAARRLYRPLADSFEGLEYDYDMHTDPILQQYYQQFHKSKYCNTCKMKGNNNNNIQKEQRQMDLEQQEFPVKQEIVEEKYDTNNMKLSEKQTDKYYSLQDNNLIKYKIEEKKEEEEEDLPCSQQPSLQQFSTFSLDDTLAMISQNKAFIQDQASKLLAEYNQTLNSSSSLQTQMSSNNLNSNTFQGDNLPLIQPITNQFFNAQNQSSSHLISTQFLLLPMYQPASNVSINSTMNYFTNPDQKPQ